MSDSRRSTLHDVARHCGVSYQTVSRVVNNHPYVSDETRQKVLKAIEEFGYRPNRAAQSLAGTRTRVLGMLTFGIENYGPAQVMIHIEQSARAAGYDLIFAHTPDSTMEHIRAALNRLLNWQIDGLIFITPITSMAQQGIEALANHVPSVQIGTAYSDTAMSVGVDQYQGGVIAADHLLAFGHRQIAEIAGPVDWQDAVERHRGFTARLHQHGIAPHAPVYGDWTAQSGYRATRELIERGKPFTGLFVSNDQMSIGALQALHERGFRVPEQVSVIGFDDIPEAAYFNPPLTTIRQDFASLGKMGIEHLVKLITKPEAEPEHLLIPPQLIERESTAAVEN